jgi:hypothetical protein
MKRAIGLIYKRGYSLQYSGETGYEMLNTIRTVGGSKVMIYTAEHAVKSKISNKTQLYANMIQCPRYGGLLLYFGGVYNNAECVKFVLDNFKDTISLMELFITFVFIQKQKITDVSNITKFVFEIASKYIRIDSAIIKDLD